MLKVSAIYNMILYTSLTKTSLKPGSTLLSYLIAYDLNYQPKEKVISSTPFQSINKYQLNNGI